MDKTRRALLLGGSTLLASGTLATLGGLGRFAEKQLFWQQASEFLIAEAAAADFTYNLQPQRIAENSYVIYGKSEHFTRENGGAIVNIAFISTEDGVVLIDTGPSRRYGEALHKMIRETTGKEIIRVYNTHFHPDHVLGNQMFNQALIAALPKTISGLQVSGEGFSENLYRLLGDWMRGTEVVLPSKEVTFSSEKFGSHRFEMLPMSGHTDADLAILDHKTGVLYTGDLCFLDRAATTPHANLVDWQASLKTLRDVPHKLLLPGHGPADPDDRAIEQTSAYLTWLEAAFISAVKSGKDMIEVASIEIPSEFRKINVISEEIERSVAHLYPALEEKYLPFVGQGQD